MIVGIEVLLWIGFTIFWGFVKAFWLPIVVIAIIVIVLISRKKAEVCLNTIVNRMEARLDED